jgi:ankyrin repeat protein
MRLIGLPQRPVNHHPARQRLVSNSAPFLASSGSDRFTRTLRSDSRPALQFGDEWYAQQQKDKALIEAIDQGDLQRVDETLTHGANPNCKLDQELNRMIPSPLHRAIQTRQLAIARRLIEAGADVDAIAAGGLAPLHVAAEAGWADGVDLLLSAGARPNLLSLEFDDDGVPPLMLAVLKNPPGTEAVIRRLAAGGPQGRARVDWESPEGKTPLIVAAERGHETLIQPLLELGASVHAQTDRGDTPLHKAATPEIVARLVQAKADIEALNGAGMTPLHAHIVQHKQHPNKEKTISALLALGANPEAPWVNRNVNPPVTWKPVHQAAYHLNSYALQALLAADINLLARVPETGETALHLLVRANDTSGKLRQEALQVYFNARGDLDPVDAKGQTPLHAAIASRAPGWVFEQLLEHGAAPAIVDDAGQRPFDLAFKYLISSSDIGLINLLQVLAATKAEKAQVKNKIKALFERQAEMRKEVEEYSGELIWFPI